MNKHLFVIFFMIFYGSVWAPISDGSEMGNGKILVEQKRMMPSAGCLSDSDDELAKNIHQHRANSSAGDLAARLAALRTAQR